MRIDPPRGINPNKMLQGAALLKEAGADCVDIGDSPMARVRMSCIAFAALCEQRIGIGEIGDVRAIPMLVAALEDDDRDVAWLAAAALRRFERAAWPELLRALIRNGSRSVVLRHGAHGVLRDQCAEGCDELLEELMRGQDAKNTEPDADMTARELEVLELVAARLQNKQIAERLVISEHTVKKYVFRIFDKLGISSRVELVLYAMRNGDHRAAEWIAGEERFKLPSAHSPED